MSSHTLESTMKPTLSKTEFTPSATEFMDHLAEELEVAPSRYEEAINRYESVGAWLNRDASSLKEYEPDVYVQGSFRLGTPIRPVGEDEHYDIDLVCELAIGKHSVSQERLKAMLGHEMQLYARKHGMKKISESRRCWTLEYADGAQFHLDALPALPDPEGQRRLLAAQSTKSDWVDSAIAITDTHHSNYKRLAADWPHSNPRGYTRWFQGRMKASFTARRNAMALEAKASVESVPVYKVKTPLQQAIQILKRHRDLKFVEEPDVKPISIIISTLAARAYNNESTVASALSAILAGMESHIQYDQDDEVVIENPTDPLENFADKWPLHPERRRAFFEWLASAQHDFSVIGRQASTAQLILAAKGPLGEQHSRLAASQIKRAPRRSSILERLTSTLNAGHRKPAPWPVVSEGTVKIKRASWTANGFSRPIGFKNNSADLRQGVKLEFRAETNVPRPFSVYWQVVNTGQEASIANALRGGFDAGVVERGEIVRRNERTSYAGSHTIECFIVKHDYLVARSGEFVVNIAAATRSL